MDITGIITTIVVVAIVIFVIVVIARSVRIIPQAYPGWSSGSGATTRPSCPA